MSDPAIDEKICKGTANSQNSVVCGTTNSKKLSEMFDGGAESKWPTRTSTHDNAKAVAKDITKLTKDDKVKLVGHLAKSIEGGEVVEIRSVSSTSVICH